MNLKGLTVIIVTLSVQLCYVVAVDAVPTYTVVDLGSLGGDYSVGLDVNNHGQVTGYSTTAAGHTHAFLYSGGVMTDLGTLGGTESYGRSINDVGQVVGDSLLSGSSNTATDFVHAFLYNGGPLIDLGTLGSNRSTASGINVSAQITGWSSVAGDVFPNWSTRPFLYSGGSMHGLPSSLGVGRSINASGQIVGETFLWTPSTPNGTSGSMTPLGSLGGGGTQAFGINDSGHVVGYSLTSTGSEHAFLFSNNSMIDLGLGRATAVNASDQVVGGEHADNPIFLYSDGARSNLNTLIPADSGWLLETAWSINDSGWITGKGTIAGAGHAYLLIPVPEPSSLVLIGFVAVSLGYPIRRFPLANQSGVLRHRKS